MDRSETKPVFHGRTAWFSSSVRYSLIEKWGRKSLIMFNERYIIGPHRR